MMMSIGYQVRLRKKQKKRKLSRDVKKSPPGTKQYRLDIQLLYDERTVQMLLLTVRSSTALVFTAELVTMPSVTKGFIICQLTMQLSRPG